VFVLKLPSYRDQKLQIVQQVCTQCTYSTEKWIFWRAGFFPANQKFWKLFKELWLARKKTSHLNGHFVFVHLSQVIILYTLTC